MGNVLFTDVCNKACSFCFSPRPSTSTFLSGADLDRLREAFRRSELSLFSITGGEPSLHPEFGPFVKRILVDGFQVRILTNGLLPEEALGTLREHKDSQLALLVNPGESGEVQGDLDPCLEGTLRELRAVVTLSITITDADFTLDYHRRLINRHGLVRQLRVGLAQPISDGSNVFLPKEDYRKVGERLVREADALAQDRIRLSFDCGVPMCMFDDSDLGKLYRLGTEMVFRCSAVVDIAPDMQAHHCFPLWHLGGIPVSESTLLPEVYRQWTERTRRYRIGGMFPQCFRCAVRHRRICAGGCLAHRLRALSQEQDEEDKP